MPVLSNARHERFAQELAQGKTADEAYELAGFKANRGNACTLKANQSVKDRVSEILGACVKVVEITADTLAVEADRIHQLACAAKQYGPATAALKLRAELLGRYVQRKEDVTPRRNKEQVDARILALLEARAEDRTAGIARGAGASSQGDETIPTVPGHGTA